MSAALFPAVRQAETAAPAGTTVRAAPRTAESPDGPTLPPEARSVAALRRCFYLYVAETPPLGVGVRTARPIAAGSVVVADEDGSFWGRTLTLEEALAQGWDRARDLFQVGTDRFLPPRGCLDDLFNHSCEPSGGWRITAGGARFVAIRDLRAGDEVTYDYSCHLLSPDEQMACACGAPSCRGLVGPFWTLPRALQARYRGLDVVSPALPAV